MKSEIRYRTRAELDDKNVKEAALKADPYWTSESAVAQIVGYCGEEIAGSEYVYPIKLRIRGKELTALSGSTLNVNSKFRRSGLGMDLPELRWQLSVSKVGMGAGLSQMAFPVHQLLDYNCYELPRYIALWKSRPVVGKILAPFADFAIVAYALLLRAVLSIKLHGFKFLEVDSEDDVTIGRIAEIVASDARACSEVHDVAWFKWHQTHSFSAAGETKLIQVIHDDDLVGFYMTKRRFYEQASNRGFKNVWLGSVIEWQMKGEWKSALPWILSWAVVVMKKDCHAAEIASDDPTLHRLFKKFGWRQMGAGNFVIKSGDASNVAVNEAIAKQENWRLRPAMGDNGL